ncbi:hypothetical protein DITRI_Ditri09bG0070000 [Diplodiscus trichospermus]
MSFSNSILTVKGDLFNRLNEDGRVLLSGYQANEISADVIQSGKTEKMAHGAFTNAVLQVLNHSPVVLSNKQLVMRVREILKHERYEQHPCLYCRDENANAIFLGQLPHAHA